MKEVSARNLGEFEACAAEFARGQRPRAEGATLVTLSGELGAGKTAFVKAAARALGVLDTVPSPTFVLENIYALPEGSAFSRLIHMDAYRLESGNDLGPLAFAEYMKDPANLIFLEWPERVADALPGECIRIEIAGELAGERSVKISE